MRIKLTHIALLISILALAVSLFTAVQVAANDNDALIDALMAQNQQLQAQIDALAGGETPDIGSETVTAAASLSAATWSDGKGADVTITLEGYTGEEALLRVMLGSAVIAEVPCGPDGTATAAVPAGNGYTYTLVTGSEAKTLASPDNPVYPELVYLDDALSAYCNLVVGEWYVRDNDLTLVDCFASIQTPRLGSTDGLTCTGARLVLKEGDRELTATAISPTESEQPGSYACTIVDAAFTLPDLPEDTQMDLWLEATLSDGRVLTTCAATWYAMPNGFSMAAG